MAAHRPCSERLAVGALIALAVLFSPFAAAQTIPATVLCVAGGSLVSIQATAQPVTISGTVDNRLWTTSMIPGTTIDNQAFTLFATGHYRIKNVGGAMVAPGVACAAPTSHVLMSFGDYNAMVNGSDVNQTLFYLGLVICLAAGFGMGWYFFGPRRKSIIEIGE